MWLHACTQVGADGGEAALAAWPAGRPAPNATFAAVAAYLSNQGLTSTQVLLSNLAGALLLHKRACGVQAAVHYEMCVHPRTSFLHLGCLRPARQRTEF